MTTNSNSGMKRTALLGVAAGGRPHAVRPVGVGGVVCMAALKGERLWRVPINADNNGGQPDGSDEIFSVAIG
ncbi:MAG: hypothetical protein WCD21_24255 [Streptomyces sp.]